MRYRRGYKYQLAEPEILQTSFRLKKEVRIPRIILSTDGKLHIAEGYCWDGASGIIDRKTNLRASLGHDALYEMMRQGALNYELWKIADYDFAGWLRQDGAWPSTVKVDKFGLGLFGGRYAHPKQRKKVFSA